mmetsp:Transcript_120819/g.301478  ORF Transcript_120819/g.301478 Transcript_120819/m.301478 type:complete len:354 (+) Transcript_120819:763-1824(+)
MEGHVRGRDLAKDRNPGRGLQFREEVEGHEGRRVEAEHVDVVLLDKPTEPIELRLPNEGVALVEVAEVVEPAPVRDGLVIALARVVARHAVLRVRALGARAFGVPNHLPLATAERIVRLVAARVAVAVHALGALRPTLRPHRLRRRWPIAVLLHILIERQFPSEELVEVLGIVERDHLLDHVLIVDGAHVVAYEVVHDAHVAGMQRVDEILQVLRCAEVLVDLVEVVGPIAHAAGAAWRLTLELLYNRSDPNTIKAHVLDVIQLRGNPLDHTTTPVVLCLTTSAWRICDICTWLGKPVHCHKVDRLPSNRGVVADGLTLTAAAADVLPLLAEISRPMDADRPLQKGCHILGQA